MAIMMSFYQIQDKLKVLIENPLNVDINLVYKDEMDFPSVTICNKLKVRCDIYLKKNYAVSLCFIKTGRLRVSFVVNNSDLLNILHLIFPHTNINVTEQDVAAIKNIDQNWSAKKFFAEAAIPKEQVILW